jgi:fatty-acyl-CoA synthase
MCRGRIAGYKLPKDVIFVADEELPRSTSGKVKRHELEERLGMDRRTKQTSA